MPNQVFAECPTCGQPITAKKLDEITARIAAEKEKEYSERFTTEVQRAVESATGELQVKVQTAENELAKRRAAERNLLEREQSLAMRNQEIDLEVQRMIAQGQEALIAEATKKAEATYQLKLEDKEKTIELMGRKVQEAESYEAELKRYRAKEKDFQEREQSIQLRESNVEAEVERLVEAVYVRRHGPEVEKAVESATNELRAKFDTAEAELAKRRAAERSLLEREQSLVLRNHEIDLEVQRKVGDLQGQLIAQATQQTEARFKFKLEEKEKAIADMRAKLLEAEAKAAAAGAQSRGGLQESDILKRLQDLYHGDDIEQIARSRGGADILHKVINHQHAEAGVILWESKNTQRWNDDWLPKLREDQRKANADVAVLLTAVLPDDQPAGGYRDGVLIIRPEALEEVAPILRQYLINLQQQKAAGQLQDEKAQRILEYLAGKEFNLLLTGIVEDINAFRELDDKEERLILRAVSQRRELRQRSTRRLARIFGTLEGIVGSLPEVPGLKLLEGPEEDRPEDTTINDGPKWG